jgi:hypothetical protein
MRVLFLVIFIFGAAVALAQDPHAKVDGRWKMTVETTAGNGNPVFELKHLTDSTLSGTYKGQLGDAAVKGTIRVKKIHLEFEVSANIIVYDGTVDGDSMKGLLKLGTMAEGSFTGVREKL